MKLDEFVLHIGHGKTGTTTLQRTLLRAHHELKQQGVYCPSTFPHDGNSVLLGYHLFLHTDVSSDQLNWLKQDYPEIANTAQKAWAKLCQDVADIQPDKVLVSSEQFFRPMTSTVIQAAQQKLGKMARSSRIIAYLRTPDTLFLSGTQEMLKHNTHLGMPSRSYVRDTMQPLINHWDGPIDLNIYDKSTMNDGDSFVDFMSKCLPDVDLDRLPRGESSLNVSLSAEAMAILHDTITGRMVWRHGPKTLRSELRRADKRIESKTRPRLRPGVSETILNWKAPDLFWLRDDQGIVFPRIDYAAIDPNEVDGSILHFGRIEDICEVNAERKTALLARVIRRASLPPTIRRWLAKH